MGSPKPCEHDPRGCLPCRRERQLAYSRERQRAKRAADPVKALAELQTWRAANPGKIKEYSRTYLQEHREERKAYRKVFDQTPYQKERRRRRSWRERGVVFDEGQTYQSLLEQQNHQCCICSCDLTTLPAKQIHVDHDHSTTDGSPNVRGILCHWCNLLLGHANDSTDVLHKAADYLDQSLKLTASLDSNAVLGS